MTRFARRGFENRKLNDATQWSDFKKTGGRKRPQGQSQTGNGSKNFDFRDRRREQRRQNRQDDRESKKVCFNCRTAGHMLSDCPFLSESNKQNFCFKCGSTEHTSGSCKVKMAKDSFPYAQCFICGTRGHISKQCPDNPRGLYPRGGGCKTCGSVEHLMRDCPQFLARRNVKEVTADVMYDGQSADAEPAPSTSSKFHDDADDVPQKKKKKVVKF